MALKYRDVWRWFNDDDSYYCYYYEYNYYYHILSLLLFYISIIITTIIIIIMQNQANVLNLSEFHTSTVSPMALSSITARISSDDLTSCIHRNFRKTERVKKGAVVLVKLQATIYDKI